MATRRLAAHKKGALATGQTLVFVDESGFSQRPTLRRTWALWGQTPPLREHFNWKRQSAAGAVAGRPGQPRTRRFLALRPGPRQPRRCELPAQLAPAPARSGRRALGGPAGPPQPVGAGVLAHPGPRADLKSHASANYATDMIDELDQHLQGATRRRRRRDGRGLSYIKHTGLVGEQEYRQLREDQ